MNTETLNKKTKIIFYTMAAVLFFFLCWILYIVLSLYIESHAWQKLVNDVDHRMKPHSKIFYTNSDGIRYAGEASSIKESDFNIIFLGDSYTYGFLLNNEFAPPLRLQKIAREYFKIEVETKAEIETKNINVINFGWTSSSPYLSLRLLKDIGKKYKPDLVILALDMTDYKDDYFYRGMVEGKGFFKYVQQFPRLTYIYKLLLVHIDKYTGLHKKTFGYPAKVGYFPAAQPLFETKMFFDGTHNNLNELNKYCMNDLGVPFVTFIPPRHWQYTDKESLHSWEKQSFTVMGPYALENFRYFDQKRSATPYPLISLLEDFKNTKVFPTTFDKDSHWNKHGANLMAELVFKNLRDLGYFDDFRLDSLNQSTELP